MVDHFIRGIIKTLPFAEEHPTSMPTLGLGMESMITGACRGLSLLLPTAEDSPFLANLTQSLRNKKIQLMQAKKMMVMKLIQMKLKKRQMKRS